MKQDDIFVSSEGNNWFNRNKQALKDKKQDYLIDMIEDNFQLNESTNVLEIGCSNGFRLAQINKKFRSHCEGLDASLAAIDSGSRDFPEIKLTHGSATSLPYPEEKFDLVVINFVLHWIDRKNLFKVISEIDRVLKNDGLLFIGDFYPQAPVKNHYHHIKDREFFTYKQLYHEIFTTSQLYSLIRLVSFDHADPKKQAKDLNDRCSLAMLRKEGCKLYAGN